ncbi:Zn-finger protein [Pseudoloma neurophilia]|uniref:Zn-finger protein n=1 Tax=Pseudoloma neurophilia TaxID=146866 RepID=A0A0R0LW62_9MICR|nr:Zn-finger protein [Pseudoloma neurophilia]
MTNPNKRIKHNIFDLEVRMAENRDKNNFLKKTIPISEILSKNSEISKDQKIKTIQTYGQTLSKTLSQTSFILNQDKDVRKQTDLSQEENSTLKSKNFTTTVSEKMTQSKKAQSYFQMVKDRYEMAEKTNLNEQNNIIPSNSIARLEGKPFQIIEPQFLPCASFIKSFGCKHYKRNCLIQFNCCERFYECRTCHNKIEDHKCNRKEIKCISCTICMTKQSFSEKCTNCHIKFGKYVCYECKFISDDKNTFHCSDCGVCRTGKRSNFFHCKQCNACLPIYIKEYHFDRPDDLEQPIRINTHVENTLKSICPICAQDLFYSTSYVVLMNCGHSIHKKCLISYKNKSFQCPICLKSSSSNQTVNERIDYILENCKDLNEQKNINNYECVTSCFDCQSTYTVKYKYLYNKCMGCGSYNTRINELYKIDDEE